MKNNYYIHRSLGFVRDYFGEPGPLVQTNIIFYYVMKILGYRTSKLPKYQKEIRK